MLAYRNIQNFSKLVIAPFVNNIKLLLKDCTAYIDRTNIRIDNTNKKLDKVDEDLQDTKQDYKDADTNIIELIKKMQVELEIVKNTPAIPIGTAIIWFVERNPEGYEDGIWLECNGQYFQQSAYPKLYEVLGTNRVPNLQGLYLRGYGSQSHIQNNGSIIGSTNTTHRSGALQSVQGDSIREIYGTFKFESLPSGSVSPYYGHAGAFYTVGINDGHSATGRDPGNYLSHFYASRVTPVSNEVRPVSMAVRYFIRAK